MACQDGTGRIFRRTETGDFPDDYKRWFHVNVEPFLFMWLLRGLSSFFLLIGFSVFSGWGRWTLITLSNVGNLAFSRQTVTHKHWSGDSRP